MSNHPHRGATHSLSCFNITAHEFYTLNISITTFLQFCCRLFCLIHRRTDGYECTAAFKRAIHLFDYSPGIPKVDSRNIGIADRDTLMRIMLVNRHVLNHTGLFEVALCYRCELRIDIKGVNMALRLDDASHESSKRTATSSNLHHL